MSDVSAVTNLIPTVNEGFITTVGGTGVSSGGATVPLTSSAGLTNGSIFVGIVEPGQTNQQTFTGTVDTSGSQITGVVWTKGSNAAHAAGVTVVDYTTGTAFNMLAKAMGIHANQNGSLKTAAVTTALTAGTVTSTMLASNAVTNASIADSSIDIKKIDPTSAVYYYWTNSGSITAPGEFNWTASPVTTFDITNIPTNGRFIVTAGCYHYGGGTPFNVGVAITYNSISENGRNMTAYHNNISRSIALTKVAGQNTVNIYYGGGQSITTGEMTASLTRVA